MLQHNRDFRRVRRCILLVLTIFILLAYMLACMHNFQLLDFVKPVYAAGPAEDYVDAQSDVDSVADKGTHSNFTTQKYTDSIYDTMTEANTNTTKVNNSENFVDNNSSNVDDHTGHGTHSSFPAMQAGPDSTFDTLTEAETAGGVPISWTEAFTSFTPVGTSWQNYDIYTNKGVPKGAIAEILCSAVNDAADRIMGVRTDGSALNRYIRVHEGEAGGATSVNMLVKVDASTGYIETYCDSTTGVTFYLLGYWTNVDFTEMVSVGTPAGTSWQNYDVYTTNGVPKGRVIQIHCYHTAESAATSVGVRIDGSSLSRYMSIHEAEGAASNGQTQGYGTYVKSDASTGYIETYASSTTYARILILGYFGSSMDYAELWTRKAIGTGWVNVDCTANLDVDGRVTNFVLTHSATGAEYYLGARIGGSSLVRYILEHESETNAYTGFGIIVQTDSGGVVQLYTGTTSEYHWLAGYFKWTPPNYELDLEFQWTTADYDETNEYLYIYTGTVNAEALKVDVRSGSSWVTIINPLLVSQCNNVSIGTYLTSDTITFRFLGGTESSDPTQSSWQIDCAIIHVWSIGVNYELELEEQFTSCEYSRTNEELCILMGTMDSETLSVQWRNSTDSTWLTIISSLTVSQWNNISVTTYLTSETFTIKFIDSLKSNDATQSTWQKDCALLHTWNLGYNLNLRVRDWDLTDSISGALVYKDTDVLTSNGGGWANWTLVTGTVAVKVKYFGFWINGTFQVEMTEDKTIDVRCRLYDVTVTVQENMQSAYLVGANVTVFNSTSTYGNRIKTGITGSNGQVSLTNLPNNTLTFTQYGKSDWSLIIGNTTQLVNTENQSITLTSNQNNLSTTDYRGLIGIIGFVIPLKRHSIKKCLKRKSGKKRKWW